MNRTYPDTLLHIAGEWREAKGGRTLPVVNPATGREIGRVAHAGIDDLAISVDACRKGFETWRKTSAFERAKVQSKAAELVRQRADQIAGVLTLEQGKPLAESRQEVLGAADFMDWAAAEGMRVYGRLVPPRNPMAMQMVVKDPVGLVAAFTPWNYPINQTVRKLATALAAGCSVVLKAAEETPAAPAALVQAYADAGLPAGVVNLVYGDPAEISRYLIEHAAIRKVTFTGSTVVGKDLAALAGRHMKRVTMELGGHAPVIVAEDADVALAVRTSGTAKFRNAGQICIAPTRFLVHEAVASEFSRLLAGHAESLKVADGSAEGTQMGPLANPRRLAAMEALTRDALERGARMLTGGSGLGRDGYFWRPTVLADVPTDARVFNEEPFGPIAAIRTFGDISEAIAEANRLSYGLAGYGFTRSLKTAHELARGVEVGMMWINQAATPWPDLPFGGVKDSGHGCEGGPEALEAYTNTRTVSITTA